jgi:hypothetical protein
MRFLVLLLLILRAKIANKFLVCKHFWQKVNANRDSSLMEPPNMYVLLLSYLHFSLAIHGQAAMAQFSSRH